MGRLYYGNATDAIVMPDHTLAYLRVIATTKLRRSESFSVSWRHPDDVAGGRSTIWLHCSIPLRFEFDSSEATSSTAPSWRSWPKRRTHRAASRSTCASPRSFRCPSALRARGWGVRHERAGVSVWPFVGHAVRWDEVEPGFRSPRAAASTSGSSSPPREEPSSPSMASRPPSGATTPCDRPGARWCRRTGCGSRDRAHPVR